MIWYILGIIMWTIISVVFFIRLMGYNFRNEQWYDFIVLIPTLLIIELIVIARL